jgi:histidine phosphotransferase ChpT
MTSAAASTIVARSRPQGASRPGSHLIQVISSVSFGFEGPSGIVADEQQGDARRVDRLLAGVFEIDGHAMADHRLHLAQAPVGLVGMAHEDARLDKRIHDALLIGRRTRPSQPRFAVVPFAKVPNHAKDRAMTDAARPSPRLAAAPELNVNGPDFAALVAARLCHDFISPASAIVSGLDLLEDPSAQDMREDAMSLIASSARKLADLLQFTRVAFGASASAENFDSRELEKLAQGVFAHVRPTMDWAIPPSTLNKASARAILNIAQIAASALPAGGKATLRAVVVDDRVAITADAVGPRARLRPEVLAGLKGEALAEGLGGPWVQAAYLNALVRAAGGQVGVELGEDQVSLAAWVPA